MLVITIAVMYIKVNTFFLLADPVMHHLCCIQRLTVHMQGVVHGSVFMALVQIQRPTQIHSRFFLLHIWDIQLLEVGVLRFSRQDL